MTAIGELTSDRMELNPDVPGPPFPLWIQVPAAWSRLDTNPASWQRSADELIDTTFRGSRLPGKERRQIMALLEGLVADCQSAGAAISLITVGRRASGGAVSFGLHLAFASDGRPASLGRVHDILPRTGVASEVSTASGPAVLHRDRVTMVVPGTEEIAALTSLQVFVPIPQTNWTVVLSTASAYPELTDALESLLRSAAMSVRVEPGDPGSGDDEAVDLVAVRPPERSSEGAPGMERGFGTLVLRKIESSPRTQPDTG